MKFSSPTQKKRKKLKPNKNKSYIRFANGIEVQLPKGWRFSDVFEIRGIVHDGPLKADDLL